MLDLETFGTRSDATIIAIGAVKFDPKEKKIYDRFYTRIDPQTSMDVGLTVNGSTILWWFQQSEAARAEFKGTLPSLKSALDGFTSWTQRQLRPDEKGIRVWGNGATFDNVILSASYAAMKMPRPWDYRSDRCYRTIKALFPEVPLPKTELIAHRADHDAEYQALHLMEIWPLLNRQF